MTFIQIMIAAFFSFICVYAITCRIANTIEKRQYNELIMKAYMEWLENEKSGNKKADEGREQS